MTSDIHGLLAQLSREADKLTEFQRIHKYLSEKDDIKDYINNLVAYMYSMERYAKLTQEFLNLQEKVSLVTNKSFFNK